MRQKDAAAHGLELQSLRADIQSRSREASSAQEEVASLRSVVEVERQRSQDVQCSLASALDAQLRKEASARSRAERAETALRAAEAAISAGIQRQQKLPEARSPQDQLVARAERAEAALVAAEAALCALSSTKLGNGRTSLLEEAENAELAHRLEKIEGLLGLSEQRFQKLEGVKDPAESKTSKPRGHTPEPSTPREVSTPPSATAVTTTFGTPCGTPSGPATGACLSPKRSPARLSRSGVRVPKPTFDGQYLSSPKRGRRPAGLTAWDGVDDDGESSRPEEVLSGQEDCDLDENGLPLPPSSRCWDWPMSKPEKQERVAMMDAQILLYDQKGLIDEVEALRDVCAQHGLVPLDDEEDRNEEEV